MARFEWTVIKPMLPNKPRGVRRANDRRKVGIVARMIFSAHATVCERT
jgi:transposase